jgi:hypothetical protein
MSDLTSSKLRFGFSFIALLASLSAACSGGVSDHHDTDGGSAGTGGSQNGGSAGSPEGGAGGATHFDASDIQLNDVSVLFPLPKTEAERSKGLLSVSAKGARGVLLPSALYDGVSHILGSSGTGNAIGGDQTADYANLRVVGMRIDPCFASLEPPVDGLDCENQLRLVVQEAQVGKTYDSALHLFYSISRAEVLELVASIGGLRQTLEPGKRLGKLQPHPIMVTQGLEGVMAAGVRAAIMAHAGEQNLIRITRMSAQQGPFWKFSGFDVNAGKLTPMHIPTLPSGDDTEQMLNRDFGDLPLAEPNAMPASGSEDDFLTLFSPKNAQALSEADQAAKFASLLRVENPAHHSPNTVDCVTCHAATPVTKLVAEPTLGLSAEGLAEQFLPDPRLVPAAELEATFEDEEPLTNIHAFSYTGTNVGINQRTVNESAAVVEYLSQQTFPGQD